MDNIEYGRRLREARTMLKMSRAKLAEIVTVHPNTLKNWEAGDTTPEPDSYHEGLLKSKAGINPHWLRTGEGDMFVKAFTGSTQVKIGGQIKEGGLCVPNAHIRGFAGVREDCIFNNRGAL